MLEWCAHLNITQDRWAAELPSVWVPELFCRDTAGTLEAVLLGETSKELVLLLATLLIVQCESKADCKH